MSVVVGENRLIRRFRRFRLARITPAVLAAVIVVSVIVAGPILALFGVAGSSQGFVRERGTLSGITG